MVNNCANPKCAKPLHYLREGRVFVFDAALKTPPSDTKRAHRLEHYWLCGACSQTLTLEQTREGIRIVPKPILGSRRGVKLEDGALAS